MISDLALLMHHQSHDELVRAAARSAMIRGARPARSSRVLRSRATVLDTLTRAWGRIAEGRSTASTTDPALCCA